MNIERLKVWRQNLIELSTDKFNIKKCSCDGEVRCAIGWLPTFFEELSHLEGDYVDDHSEEWAEFFDMPVQSFFSLASTDSGNSKDQCVRIIDGWISIGEHYAKNS